MYINHKRLNILIVKKIKYVLLSYMIMYIVCTMFIYYSKFINVINIYQNLRRLNIMC